MCAEALKHGGWVTPFKTSDAAATTHATPEPYAVSAAVSSASAVAAATDIHVSPTGSDASGDGSAAKPFASLPKAQLAARKALAELSLDPRAAADVTVHLGAGRYHQREPLVLTALDSGRNGGRMRWSGPGPAAGIDPATAAVVHGGVAVPAAGWKRSTPGSPIWSVDISALSLPKRFFNLLESGEGATLARLPDFGSGYLKDLGCSNTDTSFKCPAGVLPAAMDPADIGVQCNLGSDW
jgi:hypothetical protein